MITIAIILFRSFIFILNINQFSHTAILPLPHHLPPTFTVPLSFDKFKFKIGLQLYSVFMLIIFYCGNSFCQ